MSTHPIIFTFIWPELRALGTVLALLICWHVLYQKGIVNTPAPSLVRRTIAAINQQLNVRRTHKED